jgi:hypothetical protein
MVVSLNDRDKRQLKRIYLRLQYFRNGKIQIRKLIDDLNALVGNLENVPKEWIDKFVSYWAELEIVYSIALDDGRNRLNDQDVKRIEDSLKYLDSLLNSLIPQAQLEDVEL